MAAYLNRRGVLIMKIIITIILAMALSVPALATGPTLIRDGEGQKAQYPAWDATLSQLITGPVSQNVSLVGKLWYEFIPTADCQARLMNTTTKASWPKFTIYAKTPFRGSNPADGATYRAQFLNVSGCTGDFRAQ